MARSYHGLPFVGRQMELAKFREMLDTQDAPWLMWVVGPAGQGKSKFLEACVEECRKRKIRYSGIIDFFNDGIRTRWGVISELAKRFGVEDDIDYKNAFNQYQAEVAKGDLADADVLQFSLDQIEEALIDALRPKRISKPRVIVVDTVEEIVEGIGHWFFDKFLPRLYPFFIVVAGGRKVPTVGEDISMWKGKQPYLCVLAGFSFGDVRQFLQQDGILTDEMENYITKLHQLTNTGGQALLVALASLALKDGRLAPKDLLEIKMEEFLHRLVIDPHNEKTFENALVLELAHVYHGYTPETLKIRYTLEQLEAQSYESFLGKLVRFPYIKYHEDTGATCLHDYFRERLAEDLWTVIDPELEMRANISRQLAAFFEDQIQGHEKNNISESPALDTLRHQWLYHLLFADRERAYGELWELLDVSWHSYKYDYMDSLLDMVHEVNKVLMLIGRFDIVLDRLVKSARAWMGLESFWNTDRAIKIADEVLEDSGGVRRLELTAKVAKATALGRLGKYDEGVAALREAYQGYSDLLQIAKKAEAGDKSAMETIQSEHGVATIRGILPERYLILNTIGVFLRNRGYFDEALKEFEQSFELSRAEGDKTWQASAVTQIGTIMRYKGEYALAYDSIHQGLALRKKLGQRGREAFSLNALGMLQQDDGQLDKARDSFNEALNIWKSLRAEVDMASVIRNLGWIDYEEGKFELAEQYYAQADEIYLRKSLIRELPSLRQQQGALWIAKANVAKSHVERLGFLEKAETLLQEGLKLGDEHNQPLYSALILIGLCRIAEMRGEYESIPQWEERVRTYEREGYHFGPAYADLEEILGKISERKARKGSEIDVELFDDATDHYGQMFVYLARFSPVKYRQRREFLRQWLPSLPSELRHRACKRLVENWQNHSGFAEEHPGFIRTVQVMNEL